MAAEDIRARKIIDELKGRRWTESDAARALVIWRESGLSARAFARDHDMDAQRLLWWRKRMPTKSKRARARSSRSVARLVPAVVSGGRAASVVVRVASSLVIEVDSAAVSPAWLASLLGELARQ